MPGGSVTAARKEADARRVWAAILLLMLARVAYQIFLSPYELVADEAQYWDWSRRLSLSYYSKGPGVAWLIRLSTSVFGVSEWAIRLPAAIAFAVTAAVVARLAIDFSADKTKAARAALIAALLTSLLPAYQLSAILMTIDAPYVACWAVATWVAWRIYLRERDATPSWTAWIGCGLAVGVGFLFKYSMLLLLPGLGLFAISERRTANRGVTLRLLAACLVMTACTFPVIWWNLRHDAAGFSHLLGFLQLPGGDRALRTGFSYRPEWTLSFVLAQLAIVGPTLFLMVLGMGRDAIRRSIPVRFALCCAAPMLISFLLVTLRAPAEANWPIAAYTSLLPIAACAIAERGDGTTIRWYRGALAYGAVALLAIHAPLAVASLPGAGRFVPTMRFRGFADRAAQLAVPLHDFMARSGDSVLIVAPSHNVAGLLAFYLPDRPVVASAGRYFGDRPSAYDYFSDTALTGAAVRGRPTVFIGGTAEGWRAAFHLNDLTMLWPVGPEFSSTSFGGPRHAVGPLVRRWNEE